MFNPFVFVEFGLLSNSEGSGLIAIEEPAEAIAHFGSGSKGGNFVRGGATGNEVEDVMIDVVGEGGLQALLQQSGEAIADGVELGNQFVGDVEGNGCHRKETLCIGSILAIAPLLGRFGLRVRGGGVATILSRSYVMSR